MKLPHRFKVLGADWTMRWGDPSRELLDARKDFGCCVGSDRLIILNPTIRKNEVLAAETFAHELFHAWNAEAKRQCIKGWIEISHRAISRYESALGAFLLENGITFSHSSPTGTKSSGRMIV